MFFHMSTVIAFSLLVYAYHEGLPIFGGQDTLQSVTRPNFNKNDNPVSDYDIQMNGSVIPTGRPWGLKHGDDIRKSKHSHK